MEKYYIDKFGSLILTDETMAETFDGLVEITTPRPSDDHIYSKEDDGWIIPEALPLTDAMKKDAMLQSIFELGTDEVLDGIKELMDMPSKIQTLESRIAELESVELVTGISNPITTTGHYNILVDGYPNEYSQWSKWEQMHVYFSASDDNVDHHVGTYNLKDFASYDGSVNGWLSPTNARYVTHNVGGYLITRVPGNDFLLNIVMLSAGSIQKIKFSKR